MLKLLTVATAIFLSGHAQSAEPPLQLHVHFEITSCKSPQGPCQSTSMFRDNIEIEVKDCFETICSGGWEKSGTSTSGENFTVTIDAAYTGGRYHLNVHLRNANFPDNTTGSISTSTKTAAMLHKVTLEGAGLWDLKTGEGSISKIEIGPQLVKP